MPKQTPHDRAEAALRKHALAFDGAAEEFPWGHRAIKVKAKMFTILARDDGKLHVTVKLPFSNAAALSLPFAAPTGYGLGRSGWVTASFNPGDEVPVDLLTSWIDESYEAVAPKAKAKPTPMAKPAKKAPRRK
jgi:predicted DNA-binding protein (MmcQ/YjbR family)